MTPVMFTSNINYQQWTHSIAYFIIFCCSK